MISRVHRHTLTKPIRKDDLIGVDQAHPGIKSGSTNMGRAMATVDLTEKEKEALRLLVDGHDAKSAARALGLSVYTVNERLRDARRKMAVSSSREAARQLREAERESDNICVAKQLGGAPTASSASSPPQPVDEQRKVLRFGWVFGGIIMSIALSLLAYAMLADGRVTPVAVQSDNTAKTAAAASPAAQAARRFLELVDREDWAASWDATGEPFKSVNTPTIWAETSKKVRPPLGALRSRVLIADEWVPAPPEGYRIARFRSSFANRPEAVETLSLVQEGKDWKVVGITID